MISVADLGNPPLDAHWSYGSTHMRRISKPDAALLCSSVNAYLPRIGFETTVGRYMDTWSGYHFLQVQNVADWYYLACATVPVLDWPTVFGVQVRGVKA